MPSSSITQLVTSTINDVAEVLGVKVDDLAELLARNGKTLEDIKRDANWNAGKIREELAKIKNELKAQTFMQNQIMRYTAMLPELVKLGYINNDKVTEISKKLDALENLDGEALTNAFSGSKKKSINL